MQKHRIEKTNTCINGRRINCRRFRTHYGLMVNIADVLKDSKLIAAFSKKYAKRIMTEAGSDYAAPKFLNTFLHGNPFDSKDFTTQSREVRQRSQEHPTYTNFITDMFDKYRYSITWRDLKKFLAKCLFDNGYSFNRKIVVVTPRAKSEKVLARKGKGVAVLPKGAALLEDMLRAEINSSSDAASEIQPIAESELDIIDDSRKAIEDNLSVLKTRIEVDLAVISNKIESNLVALNNNIEAKLISLNDKVDAAMRLIKSPQVYGPLAALEKSLSTFSQALKSIGDTQKDLYTGVMDIQLKLDKDKK